MPTLNRYTVPEPPPGFEMRYSWSESRQLSWAGVYTNTIAVMGFYATGDWNSIALPPPFSTILSFDSVIEMGRINANLQCKDFVFALYQTGNMLARRSHDEFFQLYAGILMHNRPIGYIRYRPRLHALRGGYAANGTAADRNEHTPAVPIAAPELKFSTSGRIVNPEDHGVAVIYDLDDIKIDSAEIFTAFLNALAMLAPHGNVPAEPITAYSHSRRCYLNLHPARGEKPTWPMYMESLWMIWSQIIIGPPQRRRNYWGGMAFLLEFYGVVVVEGFIVPSGGDEPHQLAGSS